MQGTRDPQRTNVGLIGVGLMGHGIAKNIARAGYPLSVLEHPGNQPLDDLKAAGVSSTADALQMAAGAVANDVGIDCGAFSGGVKVSAQATRSMGGSVGFSASVGQPSTFLMVIWPDASSAQNSMAAVSAEGRTV